ncbi:MAG: hypothetical protein DME50_09485 [Verrucomicrobia bacterium]|nr:MAG: hypothetical protein DME50_09485 [Verrucomicrobiota bacterium]
MLVRLLACIVCAAMLSACSRLPEAKLIGTWRYEDEDGIEEVSFHPDHSFWSLETSKKELVTPSPLEETGSWQLKGDQLLLDSIVTWSKDRRQTSWTLLQVSRTALVTKSLEGGKSLTYKRLEEAACTPSPSAIALGEPALLGSWQTHYNTHDYQYRFSSGARVGVFCFISEERQLLLEGQWHIKDGKIFIQFQKNVYGPVEREEDIWTVVAIGTDCIAVKGDSSRPCIMRRVK